MAGEKDTSKSHLVEFLLPEWRAGSVVASAPMTKCSLPRKGRAGDKEADGGAALLGERC